MRTYESMSQEDINSDPLVVLECGHVFTTSTMDGIMDLASFYRKEEDRWAWHWFYFLAVNEKRIELSSILVPVRFHSMALQQSSILLVCSTLHVWAFWNWVQTTYHAVLILGFQYEVFSPMKYIYISALECLQHLENKYFNIGLLQVGRASSNESILSITEDMSHLPHSHQGYLSVW